MNFLNTKAKEKIVQVREAGEEIDEIETYLAYFQIAPNLGLNLSKNQRLFEVESKVTPQDLSNAIDEFNALEINTKIADYIWNNPNLKKHPAIREIITEVSNRPELDSLPLKNKKDEVIETDAEYTARLKGLEEKLKSAVLSEIVDLLNAFQANFPSASTSRAPDAAYEEGFEPGGRFHISQSNSSQAAVGLERHQLATVAVTAMSGEPQTPSSSISQVMGEPFLDSNSRATDNSTTNGSSR